MPGYTKDKQKIETRLRRIEGQVRGIQKMVEEDRYCIDVLTQVNATRAALESVALQLLADHTEHCVTEAIRSGRGKAKVRELNDAVERLVRSFALACGLGAASSSCSYAAVAVARALFRRGASFVNAIIFEFASTNLVFELGLVLLILLGWQFVAAEFAGGLLMAVILWILFKVTLRQRMVDAARRQAERGVFGSTHEAHGEMDIAITDGPFLSRIFSARGFTAISPSFFIDLHPLYSDLGVGVLIARALAAWVPNSWWQAFFLTNNPTLNEFWSPL